MATPIWREIPAWMSGLFCGAFFLTAWLAYGLIVYRLVTGRKRRLREESGLLLDKWAAESGYAFVYRGERRYGAFFGRKSPSQQVYLVVVDDREGRRRRGWVLCGSDFVGMRSGRVEVVWDETQPMPTPRSIPPGDPLWDRELDG